MIFNIIKRAKELFYNNSKSGLKATNVQDAIDEVNNNKKEWQFVGSASNGALVMIDEVYDKATEFYVVFTDDNNLNGEFIIPKSELGKPYVNGYYYDSTYYGTQVINTATVSISTSVPWTKVNNNGTKTSNGTINVYYR